MRRATIRGRKSVYVSSREVKCQICPWHGVRRYGPDGILVAPCPWCQHRVTYAVAWAGDPPVTRDCGESCQPSKPRRTMTLEHKAKLAAGRDRLSGFRTGAASAEMIERLSTDPQ